MPTRTTPGETLLLIGFLAFFAAAEQGVGGLVCAVSCPFSVLIGLLEPPCKPVPRCCGPGHSHDFLFMCSYAACFLNCCSASGLMSSLSRHAVGWLPNRIVRRNTRILLAIIEAFPPHQSRRY